MGHTCSPGCHFVTQAGISDPLPRPSKRGGHCSKENRAADEAAKRAALGESPAGLMLRKNYLHPPEMTHCQSEEARQAFSQRYQLDHRGQWVSSD
jgi:hypothetical protein